MMTRYDPFRQGLSLRRAMDQLFDQSFVNPSSMSGSPSLMAPMDICETSNGYEVDVALPGVRPEDVELTVDQNTLTIRGRFSHQNEHHHQSEGQAQDQQQPQSGQAQAESSQQQSQPGRTDRHRQGHIWHLREISSGSFERTVTFPRPIDPNKVQTSFQNGILTILLPVSEASRPRRISLMGSQSQSTGSQDQPQQVPVGAGQQQQG